LKELIIQIVIAVIPFAYGLSLLYKAYKIKGYNNEEEKEENNKKINSLRKSGNLFFIVGLFLFYEVYKMNFK